MSRALTRQYVRECLRYNPDTGVLTWRTRPDHHFDRGQKQSPGDKAYSWNHHYSGKRAGHLGGHGHYPLVGIAGHQIGLHRIAYLIMKGALPKHQITFQNDDKTDLRWANIRPTEKTGSADKAEKNARSRYLCLLATHLFHSTGTKK